MKLRKRSCGFNISFFIMIIVLSLFNVNYIGKLITSKIIDVAYEIIEKNIYIIINDTFKGQVLDSNQINDLLNIKTNNKGEIIYLDYDYKNVNDYLKSQMNELFVKVENANLNSQYYDKRLDSLMIPIGLATDNIILSNMGARIPCKVNMLNSIDISIKTRVTNYGINNSLIEVFLLLEVKSSIINPNVDRKFMKKYEVLLSSKVIEGIVPSYYGGVIEKASSIVSS